MDSSSFLNCILEFLLSPPLKDQPGFSDQNIPMERAFLCDRLCGVLFKNYVPFLGQDIL